jgi:hypothetical protein
MFEIDKLTLDTNAEDALCDVRNFQNTYSSLLSLVQRKVEDTQNTISSLSSSIPHLILATRKRPLEPSSNHPSSKRPKIVPAPLATSSPKTPDQQTTLPDPSYTGNTDISGKSEEATDEEATRVFIATFMREAARCLMAEFRDINWSKSKVGTQIQLNPG